MPEKQTIKRALKAKREGKSPSTQAGEFVREEIEHIREGKHGARSAKQAIAIGLSKARRAGVKLRLPPKGSTSGKTRKHAVRDVAAGKNVLHHVSGKRSRAVIKALQRESTQAASHTALSKQTQAAAQKRGEADRKRAARQAVRTKGETVLRNAARKAAHTRALSLHSF